MKDNDWKSRLNMVYSTNPDFEFETTKLDETQTLPPNKQTLRIELDRRHRKGKAVTLITGFVGLDEDLITLEKLLKTKCGVGGSSRDGEILLQGDVRDKVIQLLENMGYRYKRVGG